MKRDDEFLMGDAIGLWHKGMSQRAIADDLGVSKSKVGRWLQGLPRAPIDPLKTDHDAPPVELLDHSAIDPCQLLEKHSERLEQHETVAVAIRGKVETFQTAVLPTTDLIDRFMTLALEDWEKAVAAPVMVKDSDGVVSKEIPCAWTQAKRRMTIARELTQLSRSRVALFGDEARALGAAIRIERQATGLDSSQELWVLLARVMGAGYTVSS